MITEKLGVFPIGLERHKPPAVRAGGGADSLALRLSATVTADPAITEEAKQWVTAGPSVRAGAELVCQSEAGALGSHSLDRANVLSDSSTTKQALELARRATVWHKHTRG